MEEYCPATLLRNGLVSQNGDLLAEPLCPEEYAILGLDENPLFFAPLFAAGRVKSTFDLAWELAASNAFPPWSATVAVSQTNGRGQMRRGWHSPPGNLHVSFLLPPRIAHMKALASLAAGTLVCDALRHMDIPVSLKWPNDILLAGRNGTEGKFGGLLLEDKGGKTLAGLGLNLRSAPGFDELRPEHAVPAAALAGYGAEYAGTVGAFWRVLADRMRDCYLRMMVDASPEEIRRLAEDAMAWKGRCVYATDRDTSGKIRGIVVDGSLVLETFSGTVLVSSGSILPGNWRDTAGR